MPVNCEDTLHHSPQTCLTAVKVHCLGSSGQFFPNWVQERLKAEENPEHLRGIADVSRRVHGRRVGRRPVTEVFLAPAVGA